MPTDYLPRVVDRELDELMAGVAAIAVEGPRAVGKTRTSARRAATSYRLDDPAIHQIVAADPWRVLAGTPPVLIDEWQRAPECWDAVRRAVDDDPSPGRFLLTGSATPPELPTHTGAGRIVRVRMRPLSLAERAICAPLVSLRALLAGSRPPIGGSTEVGLETYVQEIVAGGFPGLRGLTGRPLRAQLDNYLDRLLDRDFAEAGTTTRRPNTLHRWLEAYAAATSTAAAYETIRDAATPGHSEKPARTTVERYLDTLERLWVVEPVPAWSPSANLLARLGSAPKHQLADPALSARLLGIDADALLNGQTGGPSIPRPGTLLGALFESLVTLSLRVYAQAAEARVMHLRTRDGDHEVDLVAERPDGRIVAFEVKLARTVADEDVRHLLWLRDRIGASLLDSLIITAGPEAYRRPDGIAVVPAALLGP